VLDVLPASAGSAVRVRGRSPGMHEEQDAEEAGALAFVHRARAPLIDVLTDDQVGRSERS
jgi:hypothetical protein